MLTESATENAFRELTQLAGDRNQPKKLQDWVDSSQESLGIVNNPVDQE